MIDLDHIEAVARAAQERSPGPWRLVHLSNEGFRAPVGDEDVDFIYDSAPKPEGFDEYDGGAWDGNRVLETDGGYYEPKGATAVHIATCSPDVVLALVERVRELTLTDEEKSALRYFADDNDNIHETALALDVIARLTEP